MSFRVLMQVLAFLTFSFWLSDLIGDTEEQLVSLKSPNVMNPISIFLKNGSNYGRTLCFLTL